MSNSRRKQKGACMKKTFLLIFAIVLLLPVFFGTSATADSLYAEAVVNADGVALRTDARGDSKIYLRLPIDTKLELMETNVNREWHKVRFKTRIGYVNRMYVDLVRNSATDRYIGTVANCEEYVNIRSAPDKKAEVIGSAKLGEAYELVSGFVENGYYAIAFRESTGYISSEYMSCEKIADEDQLSSIEVTGGTLSPNFSPDTHGYIVTVTDDTLTVAANAAEKKVRISVDNTKKSTCTFQMPEPGTRTVRIRVNGKTRYTLYFVKDAITLGTYNIKRGNKRIVEMGQMVANEKPDIMGLQECYRIEQKGNDEAIDNLISLRTKHMRETMFCPTVLYPSGGEYGIGMLSAYPMKKQEIRMLTSPSTEQRAVMRASVEIRGKHVSVYNTHLSYESMEVRAIQLSEIAEWMADDPNQYKILFGDFNIADLSEFGLLSGMKCVDNEKTRFFDYFGEEFSSNKIDNILVSENITVHNVRKYNVMLSDHRPLFAYVTLN